MKEIIGLVIIAGCFAGMFLIGWDRQDEVNCYKLQNQKEQNLVGWYATEYEIKQCLNYQIDLR